MAHPNEELLNTYFKAAESADLETLGQVFADNITAHIAGNHKLSGDYQGKDAVFGFFGKLAERSGGTARLNLHEALTDDWFAVALVEVAGRAGKETRPILDNTQARSYQVEARRRGPGGSSRQGGLHNCRGQL